MEGYHNLVGTWLFISIFALALALTSNCVVVENA
jgi:hypothetical protein